MHARYTAFVLTVGLVAGLARSDEPGTAQLKQSKAKAAQAAYVKALAAAESDFAKKRTAALRAYHAELRAAKTLATKAGDLEDANRIDQEERLVSKLITDDASSRPPRSRARGLVVIRARFGADGKWVDVTGKVAAAVRADRIEDSDMRAIVEKLPDPAFGKRKDLVVEGTYDGQPFVARGLDGYLMFGKPASGDSDGPPAAR